MKWSRRLPTKPGLYWYKVTAQSHIRWCRVWQQSNGELTTTGESSPMPIALLRGRWWAGYLPEPGAAGQESR